MTQTHTHTQTQTHTHTHTHTHIERERHKLKFAADRFAHEKEELEALVSSKDTMSQALAMELEAVTNFSKVRLYIQPRLSQGTNFSAEKRQRFA